ncbi:MAG: diguanylate cyclase domain-containing protein [Halanaerobiales bacterium]
MIIVAPAFVCKRDTFTYIYQLEKRRLQYKWESCFLLHIKVSNENNGENLKRVSNKLLDILSNNLRSSDIICRWNDNHFMLILYNINHFNSSKVMNRLSSNCFENELKFDIDIDIDYKLLT